MNEDQIVAAMQVSILIQELQKRLAVLPAGRALSMVNTKLDEANLWLSQVVLEGIA